jgi:hypothetical protein
MTTAARNIIIIAIAACSIFFGCPSSNAAEPAKRLDAFPTTLPDSTIVVFKKNSTIEVAVITNQSGPPNEGCDVQWFLRTDGKLDFSPSAPGLTTGTITGTCRIKFGPFDSGWSVNRVGRGYVYLTDDYFTGVVVQPDLKNIGVTITGTSMIKPLSGESIALYAKEIKEDD